MFVFVGSLRAQSPRLPDLSFEQRLNEQLPLDMPFRDESARVVRLGDYFNGKPVVLVLAYYRCPRLCSLVLSGLLEGLRDVAFVAGKEFEVVVVSFDAREGPELAATKKQACVEQYGRPGAERGWHFLTGDEASIRRLADAVGFRFVYDAQADDFAHASGIMVVTPTGRLSRYLFGIDYPARDLRLALVEASANRIGSPVDQVLLFCLSYDPATGKYRLTALNLVRLGGIAMVLILGIGLLFAWRRERRKARRAAAR